MALQRREFLGSSLVSWLGLGARGEPASKPTLADQLFDRIPDVPMIPVDMWFNHLQHEHFKIEPWEREEKHFGEYHTTGLYAPREVIQKAIDPLTSLHSVDGSFIGTNFRIKNGRLIFDILTVKPDVPKEFSKLTKKDKATILSWITPEPDRPASYTKPGGLDGLDCWLLPVGRAEFEDTPRGRIIREFQIGKVSMICALLDHPFNHVYLNPKRTGYSRDWHPYNPGIPGQKEKKTA